jgi:UDP-N-acetylmuramoyl-L-alanyl-D-glutamate--2,6-diaminopimelate ligase
MDRRLDDNLEDDGIKGMSEYKFNGSIENKKIENSTTSKKTSITKLLQGIEHQILFYGADEYINDVKINSKLIEPNDMYIALNGRKVNGHDFIDEACKKGARAFVINVDKANEIKLPKYMDCTIITVANTRESLPYLIRNLYHNPTEKFDLIGVTGTNGKTSVTTIAKHVFTRMNYNTGLIGTIDNYINNQRIDMKTTTPTTPDCIELGKLMDLFVQEKVDTVFMEVSSMALKNHRVDGCKFDVGVYMNISPEHLDDHKTMDDYIASKMMLFDMTEKAIVNVDDSYAFQVLERCKGSVLRFGIKNVSDCDIYAKDVSYSNTCVSFTVVYQGKEYGVKLNIPSEFAIYNNLAVLAICIMKGMNLGEVIDILGEDIKVEGRYDVISENNSCSVIIDYAHTPAALENLLTAVKKNTSYNRIITAFGCGGDRDKSKRSIMGKISQEMSDLTIITSDNPRTENPMNIIDDILKGMNTKFDNYIVIEDREKAIHYAIEKADKSDVVVIAGKGHEKVQIFNGYTIEFDDKEVARKAMKSMT